MVSEFDLITRYFMRTGRSGARTALGIGDDCALLAPAPGMHMAISCDMLVEGRHFYPDANPEWLGHKALAVNLSDLGAMGARPVAFTLALALPDASDAWLAPFAKGLFRLADAHGCELIGGDTTRGPRNICVTVFGEVRAQHALRRDAAQLEDDIWVSGTLGDARLALAAYQQMLVLSPEAMQEVALRLHAPTPRPELGVALGGLAHAAIDVSDGLVGDLGHILKRSGVGAILHAERLPVGPILAQQPRQLQLQYALAGGDDYELCFTAPAAARPAILEAGTKTATPVIRIGRIVGKPGVQVLDAAGMPLALDLASFDHFLSA